EKNGVINEKYRLSPRGQLDWNTGGLKQTGKIYAVFSFKHYDVNIYAFSDTKNFTGITNLSQNKYDEIGGKVAVKSYLDDGVYSYGGFKTLKIADGYAYSFGVMTNETANSNMRYRYVGIYYSLSDLLKNKANDDADITSVSQRFTVDGKNVNLYAKFVMEYAFTVSPADEGMDKVSLGDKSAVKGVTEYYYYGQTIGRISSIIDTRYYESGSPAWKVVLGTLSSQQTKLLSVQTIANGLVMPDQSIEIKAQVVRKFFDLTVFAIYAEMNMYEFSAKGGTANITTTDSTKVKFQSNNGVMGLSFSVTAKVEYKSDAITLVSVLNTNFDYGTQYKFVGWYDSFEGFDLLGARLDNPEDNGTYHIEEMKDGMTFYCAFAKSYYVQVSVDDRVRDVVFDGLEKQQETNPLTGVTRYFTYANYSSKVNFELIKERGEIDKFYQTQGGPDVALSSDETKTLYSFSMPNYPVYIEITTKGNKFYALTLRAVLIDDMQALYDDDEDFETEVGDVRAKEVDKTGTTVAIQVEETRTRTLLATPGVGYSFFGWYKLRTDVSFTKIMKEGAPSYTQNIDTWLNIYNPTSNPNGAYVYFGSDPEVVSDPIERSNKNLYVAVFVKNYTISLIKGDRGIEELGFETHSPYDRNSDGENDALNAEIDDQGSTVIITVPYGSQFDVWSKIRENYTFSYYDIISGKPSLSHYPIAQNKILPDEEFLLEEEDYLLSFYLYDNIKLISKTNTVLQTATVNVYTLDIENIPVLSMEGGTFNMATSQAQSFDIIIGTSLIGFIKVEPGFVFSHFEVNGEEAAANVGMPAEDCEINVYFARNAYILNTYIKTIGDDGILADNDNGGVVEVNHSILYGGQNTLNLTASMGYVLKGIYLDENCTIKAPNYDSQIAESEKIEDYQFYYSYTTEVLDTIPETPKIPAFNFYIVYEFLLFDIEKTFERKELNTNKTSEMPDGNFDVFDISTSLALTKGYYGEKIMVTLPESEDLRYYNSYAFTVYDKTNNQEVELFYDLEADSVEVTENGLGTLSDGITAYFIMPLGEIEIKLYATYHEMNIIIDSFSNTGTFDNEYVQAGPTGYAELSVFYGYNNYAVKEGTEIKLDVLLSGVPYATKKGFKLVAYNTEKDRSGTDFITYQYDADDEVISVTRNDFVFAEAPVNYGGIVTLYAIYDYANIEMHLNYCLSGEEYYNGSLQALMQIDVYNYNAEIPYVYTWYDKNNNLIGRYDYQENKFYNATDEVVTDSDFAISKTTADDKVVNILQLRSVNQTGTYTCVVSIKGGAMFEEKQISVQENRYITIMPIDIGIFIQSNTPYFGATAIEVTNANAFGLLPMHVITGTVGMTRPGVYNNENRPEIDFTVENTALTYEKGYKVTVQDGVPIASNYTVSFEGECEIKEPAGLVTISSGIYFRSIDMASNNEVYNSVASTEIKVTSMNYAKFVQTEPKYFYGKLTNFVAKSETDFGQAITLTLSRHQDYGFYKLYVNDTEITSYMLNDITLTFDLEYDYINADDTIDIKVYLTNECLVTAVYNVDGVDNYVSRQVYNEEFKAPPAVEGKTGYVFEGWYLDENCTKNVAAVWQVWGNQTIYANWTLVDVSEYISIVVTDNGEEVTLDENKTYNKTYDAKNVALNFKISIEGFTGEATWFKKDRFASWV
ncbi:MAG: InlB B-repeat-containing protein, partial [Clostridia bacterium]|nr:InlB B-repeat-containing protein [Clostridia bacterium]